MLLSAALLSLLCTGAILAAEPADFTTRFAQAQAYQKADDDQKALRVLEGPQPPPPLRDPWKFTRAFSLFRLGRLDSAEKVFRDLLSNPDLRAPANFFLANCMFARGRYSASLFYYEAAIAAGHSPDNRALNAYYYNQGLAFHQLHRFREAAEAFRNSIDLYAQDPLPRPDQPTRASAAATPAECSQAWPVSVCWPFCSLYVAPYQKYSFNPTCAVRMGDKRLRICPCCGASGTTASGDTKPIPMG